MRKSVFDDEIGTFSFRVQVLRVPDGKEEASPPISRRVQQNNCPGIGEVFVTLKLQAFYCCMTDAHKL